MIQDYPLISIIIPVYNRAGYITIALDSILTEDYPDKEIVLVDDGSTDASVSVIKAWIQSHPETSVTFVSRENRGVTTTVNDCIRLSKGKYIVLLDSDDYLINPGIRKRYEYLKAHPDKLFVFADCILIDEDNKMLSGSALSTIGKVDTKHLNTDYELRKFAVLNGFTTGSTMMADRRLYDIVGFHDERLHSQDYIYHLRVAARNMMGYVDETVSAYRIHNNNMSMSYTQILVVVENAWGMLVCLKDYPELEFKIYLILNVLRDWVRIPYLFVKFTLLNILKSPNRYPLSVRIPVSLLLKVLNGVKNTTNMLTAKIYLKKPNIS